MPFLKKKIEFEESLNTNRQSVAFFQTLDSLSLPHKALFSFQLAIQVLKFTYAVRQYHYARDNLQPLPKDFELSFEEFAKKNNLEYINLW